MMKSKIRFGLIALILLLVSSFSYALYLQTLLVLDMDDVAKLPRNFRATKESYLEVKKMNLTGFSDLHIAGGAQYSELALDEILQALHQKQITVIDLRQEAHGFIDGKAVSWYAPHDAVNQGKDDREIERNQVERLDKLSKFKTVKLNVIVKKNADEVITQVKTVTIPVRRVFSEKQIAEKMGQHYERIYVQDFHAPATEEVDRFIEIVKQLPANEWIYFHCRAGVGRTTTFMVMYDMMKNAKQVSFLNILARQAAIGGKDLTEVPEPGKWKYQFAVQRLRFLKMFYEYAQTNNDNYQTTWSAWIAKRGE